MEYIQVMRGVHNSVREQMIRAGVDQETYEKLKAMNSLGAREPMVNSLSGEANFEVPAYLLMPTLAPVDGNKQFPDKYTDAADRPSEPSAQQSLTSSDLVLEIGKDTDDAKYSE